MCNTTCNNPSYIDSMDNIPENANIVYVLNDECECCKCNKSICEEPKKVSCRSLACQQLNEECSCKKRKKTRKTTMVNVLENNVIRLEDKMNSGCSEMHQNIEEIINTVNNVYNELKDEEARAKLQEAFLHYGLDDAITRVEYNPEDRRMHFYHKNPANCLNVNVHEGCDCDCCNACGCECSCNTDECQSDIPYTMDEDCNIIPMSREEEELFSIDCRDFIRDIFINSARLEYDYPNAVDGNLGEGPWLVISFKRTFESDLADDDENANPVEDLWIDLSKIWKLENYYDKEETRDEIRKVHITNMDVEVPLGDETTIAVLTYDNTIDGTPVVQPIKIKIKDLVNTNNKIKLDGTQTVIAKIGDDEIKVNMPKIEMKNVTLAWAQSKTFGNIDGTDYKITTPSNPADGLQEQITNLGDNITSLGDDIQNQINNLNIPEETTVSDKAAQLVPNEYVTVATINDTDITVKMPNIPGADDFAVTVTNNDPTLATTSVNIAKVGDTNISAKIPNAVSSIAKNGSNLDITPISGSVYSIPLPTFDGPTTDHYVIGAEIDNNNTLHIKQNEGLADVTVALPAQEQMPKHITNITQEGNVVTFTWSDNSTTQINVGGACLWKENGDGLIPVNESKKVYGAGFYDTTVTTS